MPKEAANRAHGFWLNNPTLNAMRGLFVFIYITNKIRLTSSSSITSPGTVNGTGCGPNSFLYTFCISSATAQANTSYHNQKRKK